MGNDPGSGLLFYPLDVLIGFALRIITKKVYLIEIDVLDSLAYRPLPRFCLAISSLQIGSAYPGNKNFFHMSRYNILYTKIRELTLVSTTVNLALRVGIIILPIGKGLQSSVWFQRQAARNPSGTRVDCWLVGMQE